MRKLLIGMIFLTMMVAACAPQTPTEQPSIIIEPPTDSPAELTPAQSAAVTLLSETLNLPADEIAWVSTEAVTWPDGCLGVQRMGVLCTQAEVPGFRIVLEVNGEKYEVHTDKEGESVVLAEGAQTANVAEEAVIKQLAENLGLDESEILVLGDEVVEFGDACMGVSMENVMCAQVVTPGHIILLEANGVQYEYHTSADGSRVQPAILALTWKREGGIAGFCDSLTVFLSGEVYGNQCKTEDGRMGTFASLLSSSEQKQFNIWMAKYGQVDLDASDPKGVADGMTLLITLYGTGSSQPSKSDQAAIFAWVQGLHQKLYS